MEQVILKQIRKELLSNVDLHYKEGSKIVFKEGYNNIGVRLPIVRRIAKKQYKEVRDLTKKEIFDFCEELLKTGYHEEALIAFAWSAQLHKQFTLADFSRFERWLKKYVINWALCDDFCTHSLHYFMLQFPQTIPKIKKWTSSKNKWVRRAAAVSFISSSTKYFVRGNLNNVFEVATILLTDSEDMVQKGYGWMLKAASVHYQKEVFDFVLKNKKDMPRTALRYAIEHMPKEMKKKAMKR